MKRARAAQMVMALFGFAVSPVTCAAQASSGRGQSGSHALKQMFLQAWSGTGVNCGQGVALIKSVPVGVVSRKTDDGHTSLSNDRRSDFR